MAKIKNEENVRSHGAESDFNDRIQDFEKNLESISQHAGEKMGEFVAGVANSTSGYTRTGRDYIKENPLQSVMIAAAAGAALGGLLTLLLRGRD